MLAYLLTYLMVYTVIACMALRANA